MAKTPKSAFSQCNHSSYQNSDVNIWHELKSCFERKHIVVLLHAY